VLTACNKLLQKLIKYQLNEGNEQLSFVFIENELIQKYIDETLNEGKDLRERHFFEVSIALVSYYILYTYVISCTESFGEV